MRIDFTEVKRRFLEMKRFYQGRHPRAAAATVDMDFLESVEFKEHPYREDRIFMRARFGAKSVMMTITHDVYVKITGNHSVDDSVSYNVNGEVTSRRAPTMIEKKKFSPGKLINREQFEAASSVIAQACANGQYGGTNGFDDGSSTYHLLTRRFQDPQMMREKIEARLAEKQAELDELNAEVETQRAQLESITVEFPNGSKVKFAQDFDAKLDAMRGQEFKSVTIVEKVPGRECSCAYNGFKFHTQDCAVGMGGKRCE